MADFAKTKHPVDIESAKNFLRIWNDCKDWDAARSVKAMVLQNIVSPEDIGMTPKSFRDFLDEYEDEQKRSHEEARMISDLLYNTEN